MSIKETLLKAKKTMRTRVDSALGRGAEMDPQAVRQEIFSQIESKIVHDSTGSVFPFDRVVVRLRLQTKAQSEAMEGILVHENTLKSDVLRMLTEAHVRYPQHFEALVEVRQDFDSDHTSSLFQPPFEIDFIGHPVRHKETTPEIRLQILSGIAEHPQYVMKKDRILFGRSREVLDREGRMVRRNDIVFLENDEEANCSVGRTHARILYDHAKQEFSILDEGSRYGTRILRGGAVIEVAGEEPNGIPLQSGDDVYLGQACFRFTVA